MNGRIVEWVGNGFNTPAYKQNDIGEKVPNPDNDAQRVIIRTGQVISFSKASAYGGADRPTQLLSVEDAKEIMERYPQLFRYADDLEQVERQKEIALAMVTEKDALMDFVRDNAQEVAGLLAPYLKGRPGRPLKE